MQTTTPFIDNTLITNDELMTWRVHSTIKRTKYELGWVIINPKYCQPVHDVNKEKRQAWCEKNSFKT